MAIPSFYLLLICVRGPTVCIAFWRNARNSEEVQENKKLQKRIGFMVRPVYRLTKQKARPGEVVGCRERKGRLADQPDRRMIILAN